MKPTTDRFGLVFVGDITCDDDELVATEAADQILWTERPTEPLSDLKQHDVADAVALSVIDELESVEVDEQDSGHLRGLLRFEPIP